MLPEEKYAGNIDGRDSSRIMRIAQRAGEEIRISPSLFDRKKVQVWARTTMVGAKLIQDLSASKEAE